MTESKKLKYRYFFLSFAISFLVLSLLFYMLMNAVHPQTPQSLVDEPATENLSAYLPSKEDSLTVLFVGIAPTGAEADTFLLARFDPVRGKVPIVVFPKETAVRNNNKVETLAQVYKYGGTDYTRNILAENLGIPIDRYVRMDISSFVTAAAAVGTVEFNLGHDVTLGQSGELPVTLGKGIQLLDGQKAANIIHYDSYAGGELSRCATTADLTAAIVNQRMDIVLSTVVDKVFSRIINLIDTDISYPDYDNRKEAAAFLAQLGEEPAVAIKVSGTYSPDGELYTLTDTFVALLTQTFV